MDIGLINAAIETLDVLPKFPNQQTVGDKIRLSLNIPDDVEAAIQKVTNYAHPIYRVVINSRFPYRSILYSQIRNADSLKAGQFNDNVNLWKSYKWTPPKDLNTFDSPISNKSIIMFADLAVETYLDPTLYECKSVGDKVRLEEFTIADFKNNISDVTKYWSQERKRVAGADTSITKVVDFEEPGIFIFLTEPTYKHSIETLPDGKFKSAPKRDNLYTLKLQIDKFDEWFPDPLKITFKEFKEVMKAADVKFDSDDLSYHFQGFRYKLSQIDSAIYPTTIPDTQWDKVHKGGLLSKHLFWLVHYMNFHLPAMYRKMKDYYLKRYGQPTYPEYQPGKIKIKTRDEKDIVPRK